jgi:V/A-type H+-transporting ATPase subunit E
MAEEIKDLIAKIQKEGIQAAEDQARAIESQAKLKAEEIVKKAKAEAEKLIRAADEQITKAQESSQVLLKQAGRDMILSLRKEIDAMLDTLILSAAKEALKPQELVKIISSLVKHHHEETKANIVVSLNNEDLEKLEEGLFSELGREAQKGIILRGEDQILAGFMISFDAGKSQFDFTDQALSEYIGSYLKPKLKEILE